MQGTGQSTAAKADKQQLVVVDRMSPGGVDMVADTEVGRMPGVELDKEVVVEPRMVAAGKTVDKRAVDKPHLYCLDN